MKEFLISLVDWLSSKKVKTALTGKLAILVAAWLGLTVEDITVEVAAIVSTTIGAVTGITYAYLNKQGAVDVQKEVAKPADMVVELDDNGEPIR